jgi:hypothetical protein
MPGDAAGPSAHRLAVGNAVTVTLLKQDGTRVTYDMVVIADNGEHLVVRGPWAEAGPRDLGFTTFAPGDVFTEHYWRRRWYSVKEVRDGEGRLKGWYCDVARPVRVEPGLVLSEDLILDVWVSSDGTALRLDEEEFRSSGLRRTDPEAANRAADAVAELETLARDRFRVLR